MRLRRLGNSKSFRQLDDFSRIEVDSLRYYFILFLDALVNFDGYIFLRHDLCVGSVNCMHIKWKSLKAYKDST